MTVRYRSRWPDDVKPRVRLALARERRRFGYRATARANAFVEDGR